MGITKREYDAVDGAIAVLYAKKDDTQTVAYPVLMNAGGGLYAALVDAAGNTLSFAPRSQTPTGGVLQVQIGPGDIISNLPVFVDYEHHQVHEGETLLAQYIDTSLETNTRKFGIKVATYNPANAATCPHMVIGADIYNGAARIDIYEGAAIAGGTLMTVFNRERNIAFTGSTQVLHSVTSATGTLIESFFCGQGSRTQGASRQDSELVLKSATNYRIDVTGLAAGTDAIISFNFYEDLGV